VFLHECQDVEDQVFLGHFHIVAQIESNFNEDFFDREERKDVDQQVPLLVNGLGHVDFDRTLTLQIQIGSQRFESEQLNGRVLPDEGVSLDKLGQRRIGGIGCVVPVPDEEVFASFRGGHMGLCIICGGYSEYRVQTDQTYIFLL
jgi:hypothetical protein